MPEVVRRLKGPWPRQPCVAMLVAQMGLVKWFHKKTELLS